MKKRRIVVTIDPGVLAELDATCKRIHHPRPNRSAAVEEAVRQWVYLKRASVVEGLDAKLPDIEKPALRMCKGPQFGASGCDQWTHIPPGETAAPCRHCGKEVSR